MIRFEIHVVVLMLASFVAGCGSATGLKVGAAEDAGVDADGDTGEGGGVDDAAGRDAGQPDAPPFDGGFPPVLPRQPVDPTCIELPNDGPIELSLRGRVRSADVLFLIDRTGSMSEEIDEIRDQLAEVLIPQLQSLVGSLAMGVAVFDEVDYPPYGSTGLQTVRTLAPLSTDHARTLFAIEEIVIGGGTAEDPPEAAVPALYTLFNEQTDCGFGNLCLRPDVVPVVLLFTDAAFHNGPAGELPYGPRPPPREPEPWEPPPPPPPPPPATYQQMLVPVRAHGARVLGLYSGPLRPEQPVLHLRQLARDTGALDTSGEPIFFNIGLDGRRVGDGVAAVVGSLFGSAPIGEISASVSDVPDDDVDATPWVRVVASRALPSRGATIDGDIFRDVRPGAVVIFRLDVDPPEDAPIGVYPIEFTAVDGTGEVLDQRLVRLVIPGPGVSCDLDP